MTLEGCVVRISDIVAYIGRDIEDAVLIDKIKKEDIPEEIVNVLGDNNRDIINNIVIDIITNSLNKPYISMSPKIFNTLNKLKDFNYEQIYNKAMAKEEKDNCEKMFNDLFHSCLEQLENKQVDSDIFVNYLNKMNNEYLKNTNARIVIDYIAGMTDAYFINQYKKYCTSRLTKV